MGKRIFAVVLCLFLLVASVPVAAAADQSDEAKQLERKCASIVYRVYASADPEELKGLCGYMTAMQLYLMGCTTSLESYNGRDYFDAYSQQSETSGGYAVRTYSAGTYSLEEALMTVTNGGSQSAYNIVVCFQRTNTSAGQLYGHALMIHGIVDGVVYFAENYYSGFGGPGTVHKASISDFAAFFDSWTQFEGLIYLGQKSAADASVYYNADLFVSCKGGLLFADASCEADVVRTISPNEVLKVGGIYKNTDGVFFFKTAEGFVEASLCQVDRVNTENVSAWATLPETIRSGEGFAVTGEVLAVDSAVSVVQISVVNSAGQVVQSYSAAASGHMNRFQMNVQGLSQGSYRLQVLAMVENYTLQSGKVVARKQMVKLSDEPFGVDCEPDVMPQEPAPLADGWHYIDGVRYFYQNGAPRVGWYCDNGADYYFKEDGSVTTGWVEINGRIRCFSDTGVMRIGWVEAAEGTYYMLSNGVPAVGRRTIDGMEYTFDENGLLVAE